MCYLVNPDTRDGLCYLVNGLIPVFRAGPAKGCIEHDFFRS